MDEEAEVARKDSVATVVVAASAAAAAASAAVAAAAVAVEADINTFAPLRPCSLSVRVTRRNCV